MDCSGGDVNDQKQCNCRVSDRRGPIKRPKSQLWDKPEWDFVTTRRAVGSLRLLLDKRG